MQTLKQTLAVVWLLVFTAITNAQTHLSDSQLNTIAVHPTWQALIHYSKTTDSATFISQVDDPDFFLSSNGRYSPADELKATINALYNPEHDAENPIVCRFPARWIFLNEQLSLPPPATGIEQCSDYQQWLTIIKPFSASLVFASSYLNSPSSMFGHTFVRIDPENVEQGSNWLSYAVNFGAAINSDDNSILYAYKGLFGGYPGFFSVIPYYEKIKEYSRIENRDLWEYNLNLTPEETQRMISHLWELKNIEFDYYFFDENCSYRLLELLEFARPGTDLRKDFELRAIPVDTVRAVVNAELVDSVTYRPSEASDIQFQIDQLTQKEQRIAKALANQTLALDADEFTQLPDARKAHILWVSYKTLRYQQLDKSRNTASAQHSLGILKALNQLPSNTQTLPTPAHTPDNGHKTLLLGVAPGTQDHNGFLNLRARLSYHDLADNIDGYLPGASINLGELVLRQPEKNALQIELFNVIDIKSHSPRTLFFDPTTWRIQVGFDRVYSNDDDTLAARLEGGAGVTFPVFSNHLLYGMAMARGEYNKLLTHNWNLGLGGLAGALFFTPWGSIQLESVYYQFLDQQERTHHQFIYNLPLDTNNALRLSAEHKKQIDIYYDEFNLEYRHYF